MSFSFSSMLRKGSSARASEEPEGDSLESFAPAQTENNRHPPAMSQPTQQPNPLPFGGTLFRTLGNEDEQGAPVAASASPFGTSAPSGGSLLTVGDVLSQLPPDLAKASAIPPDHPIQISSQVLRAALSSGQPAIPLFELYRVCPGIFQMPVSPDDTRLVPLPASKLPALLAATGAGSPVQTQAAPTSPFGAQGASPFGAPAASPFSAPPASPFGAAPAQNSPQQPPASPFSGSPFGSPPQASPQAQDPAHSPFQSLLNGGQPTAARPAEHEAPRNPTSLPPRRAPDQLPAHSIDPVAAPEGFIPQLPSAPAAAGPSPFLSSPPAAAPREEPPAASAPPSTPFAPAAAQTPPPTASSPFAQPAAEPPTKAQEFTQQPPAQAPAAGTAPSQGSRSHAPCSAPLVALLQRHGSDELGFDPAMVPSWITTMFHSGTVAELHEMERPSMDLGTIIDGITDIGFRNVLQSARRGTQIGIPLQVLTPLERSSIPEQSAVPSAPEKRTMRVGPEAESTQRVEPGNPFAAIPDAPSPSTPAPQPQPAAQPEPPRAEPAAFAFPIPEPPPSSAQPPAAAAPAQPPAAPAERSPSGFIQPAPGALFAFGTPASTEPPAGPEKLPQQRPATSEEQLLPTKPQSPFGMSGASAALDPFAKPSAENPAASSGFSSSDLLGKAADFSEPPPPPLFPGEQETPEPPAFPTFPETSAFLASPAPKPAAAPEAPTGFSFQLPPTPQEEEAPKPAQPPLPANWPSAASTAPAERPPERATPVAPPQPAPAPEPPAQEPSPAFAQAPAPIQVAGPKATSPGKATGIDLSTLDTSSDRQLLLRALLGSDQDLSLSSAMEMTASLPGLEACILVNGNDVMAHCSSDSAEAQAFRSQAAELARSLRTLGPLIGIEGAETFTLKSNDRVITFCSPGTILLGVLHRDQPSLGLRDKVTLIARQLDKMITAD